MINKGSRRWLYWSPTWAPLLLLALLTPWTPLQAKQVSLKGRVYGEVTREPVPFALIAIPEAQEKYRCDEEGGFEIQLPPGDYTLLVTAPGVGALTQKVALTEPLQLELYLQPLKLNSSGATIEAEREIQKISRYTITNQEIKSVPATLGDSLGAVSTLAGIERTGTFGPLSIRGLNQNYNTYTIDHLPIIWPQHFGGLHAVIHSDIIDTIDIYSSSFPVTASGGLGSAIEINTIDKVDKLGGYADIGILSANALLKKPIERGGDYRGYWIVAARYGYLSLIAPRLIEEVTGEAVKFDIDYYDYQAKGKYYLNKDHALTLFFFGGADLLALAITPDEGEQAANIKSGVDPFTSEPKFDMHTHFHLQSLLYTWRPSDLIYNKLRLASSLNSIKYYLHIGGPSAPEWARDNHILWRPEIYLIQNETRLRWLSEAALLKLGLGYTYVDFTIKGVLLYPTSSDQNPNYADENQFLKIEIDERRRANFFGGYLENTFFLGPLEVVAGVTGGYSKGDDITTLDPRGRLSYSLPSRTSLSLAGGFYSDTVSDDDDPGRRRAYHRAIGAEQKIGESYLIKLEGYLNSYSDLLEENVERGGEVSNERIGEIETHGVEVTLRKTREESARGHYGWLSYTYGAALYKSNRPPGFNTAGHAFENYGDRWIPNDSDRTHSLKLVSGFRHNKHYFDARFQYYSSFPYTPIVGDDGDPLGINRYNPALGEPNSGRFPPDHRLDLRYSRRSHKRWGNLTWYLEVLNLYNTKRIEREEWRYDTPYQAGVNPVFVESDTGFNIIPNFGLEARF